MAGFEPAISSFQNWQGRPNSPTPRKFVGQGVANPFEEPQTACFMVLSIFSTESNRSYPFRGRAIRYTKFQKLPDGGRRGIRTPTPVEGLTVFKTAAVTRNLSAYSSMAESDGIEPLTLLRCHHAFPRRLGSQPWHSPLLDLFCLLDDKC